MEYRYSDAEKTPAHTYLLPPVLRCLERVEGRRLFELGCGNGAIARELAGIGYSVVGIDSSESGIQQARATDPRLDLHVANAYDDLATKFGRFPIVLSLEVVEHVYDPRLFARRCFELLETQGTLILSTPFHGYWKNLALALSGRMDAHFTALWDGGHIKFWSERTLGALLAEAGFIDVRFCRVGRIRPLAKSMIITARRP